MAPNVEILRDIDLVQSCLEGDQDVIAKAQEIHLPFLRNFLAHRGASESETDEMLGTLWGDCLVGDGTRPPLFEKYDGKSALRPWLIAIIVNRWISSKRRERARRGAIDHLRFLQENETAPESLYDPVLVEIVGKAIRKAFAECDAEGLVMLRLIHIYGLTRKEVVALWACHESTVSRRLADIEKEIGDLTRHYIRQMDPFFELSWDDILLFSESAHLIIR